jgi:hypothetical protein
MLCTFNTLRIEFSLFYYDVLLLFSVSLEELFLSIITNYSF